MQRLNVVYNDGMRLLFKVPQWSSASKMFVSAYVPTCAAVMRNLMYRCMFKLLESLNTDELGTKFNQAFFKYVESLPF